MTMEFNLHTSVLANEVIDALKIAPNGIYVDCTIGRGGHVDLMLNKYPNITIIGIDKDLMAINFLKSKFEKNKNVYLVHDDFKNIESILKSLNIQKVNGFLFDLGVSSPQLDDPSRGFSYHHNARLDMRMNQQQSLDAFKVVNEYDEEDLIRIFKNYGEIKKPNKVVRAIIKQRQKTPIQTTFDLVKIIKENASKDMLTLAKHPAKRFFQAIRIEVNNELVFLSNCIKICFDYLLKNGTIAIISFHSLEDKIIKTTFNELINKNNLPSYLPIENFNCLTSKVIYPSELEIINNKRSRSAKLRILYK